MTVGWGKGVEALGLTKTQTKGFEVLGPTKTPNVDGAVCCQCSCWGTAMAMGPWGKGGMSMDERMTNKP